MQFDERLKKYFKKKGQKKWTLNNSPSKNKYKTIIIVPSKAENDTLPLLLNSISKQNQIYLKETLIIIVINNSKEDSDSISNNSKTITYLNNTNFNFDISYIDASTKNNFLPTKDAGVGLARKIGADLALEYCNKKSVLCYTDADAILSNLYLEKIMDYYKKYQCGCAIVNFKHQKNIDLIIEKNIRQYEKFLLKTAEDLKSTGSPYGYISLGSCMTCTADAYISVGGMNKMKATEDFYFLQSLTKHFQSMNIIKDKIVYPSSRISSRVYLGTGYRMKTLQEGFDINNLYFSKKSFSNLNQLLIIIKDSYGNNINELLNKTKHITDLNSFLNTQKIDQVWNSLINNVDYNKFIAQFHRWFDALKTIKFLKYFSN